MNTCHLFKQVSRYSKVESQGTERGIWTGRIWLWCASNYDWWHHTWLRWACIDPTHCPHTAINLHDDNVFQWRMLLSPWTPFCQFPYCDINLEADRPCSGLATLLIPFASRGSSVGIVTGCELDECGSIADRGKDCFSLPSGAHLASCPMCTRGTFQRT